MREYKTDRFYPIPFQALPILHLHPSVDESYRASGHATQLLAGGPLDADHIITWRTTDMDLPARKGLDQNVEITKRVGIARRLGSPAVDELG